jgi:hypothetical protein
LRRGDNLIEKKLESSLRVAIRWLESRGYRYAVIGGIAVSQWGKDWEDIEVLVNAHYMELDKSYIENWLSQFAEALEKPELLAEYHRLLAKAKSQDA